MKSFTAREMQGGRKGAVKIAEDKCETWNIQMAELSAQMMAEVEVVNINTESTINANFILQ